MDRHIYNFVRRTMVPGTARLIVEQREIVGSICAERQGIDLGHSGEIEIAIKMGKQRPAARGLPFQFVAEQGGIDADEQQIALAGEMPGRGLGRLRGG